MPVIWSLTPLFVVVCLPGCITIFANIQVFHVVVIISEVNYTRIFSGRRCRCRCRFLFPATLIRAFHIGDSRKRIVMLDVSIYHMTKLLFRLLVIGPQYNDAILGGFSIFVSTKSTIVNQRVLILGIYFDVVHIIAFGTKLHFAIYYGITLCHLPVFNFLGFNLYIFDIIYMISTTLLLRFCKFRDPLNVS